MITSIMSQALAVIAAAILAFCNACVTLDLVDNGEKYSNVADHLIDAQVFHLVRTNSGPEVWQLALTFSLFVLLCCSGRFSSRKGFWAHWGTSDETGSGARSSTNQKG